MSVRGERGTPDSKQRAEASSTESEKSTVVSGLCWSRAGGIGESIIIFNYTLRDLLCEDTAGDNYHLRL
jgi:hypothetical protein